MLHGVQAIRTHIDVTDPTFTGLKAALEVKDEVKDILDLQIVAFPQEGMYAYKGGDKLVEEGRQDTYPKRRGITRVKELYNNGINVCLNDTVRDPHLFHHKPIASLPILLGSE